jgi:ATPase subunit of ABC transporter with duplicated ATPase domains
MKREFLKDLGIADDVVDKIMAENGKDINDVKAKFADYDNLKKQIAERDKQLEELKKTEPEKLQAEIARLQQENTAVQQKFESELKAAKLNFALETHLTKAGAVNVTAVKALLDHSKISLDGDHLIGLDDQLKTLKEKETWAFKPQTTEVPGSGGNPAVAGTQKNPLPSGTVIF